jgi:hypothetical protein
MSGEGNRNTQRKHTRVSLCPPEIPNDFSRGLNPIRRCGKPANNRLKYGTESVGLTDQTRRLPTPPLSRARNRSSLQCSIDLSIHISNHAFSQALRTGMFRGVFLPPPPVR